MSKLMSIGRCNMCLKTMPQLSFRKVVNRSYSVLNVDDIKEQLYQKRDPTDKVNILTERKSTNLRARTENVTSLKQVLEEYDIETVNLSELKNNKFLKETSWTVERRIMLLQEIGVQKIQCKHLFNFRKMVYLPVKLYKAHMLLDPSINLARNMLSWVENPKVDYRALSHLTEDMTLKQYYNECFIHYIKIELKEESEKIQSLYIKKYSDLIYNSFRLIQKLIKLYKDLEFSNDVILENPWLLSVHPGQAESILNIMKTEQPDVSLNIFKKNPRMFEISPEDFRILLGYFKHYKITTKMIESTPEIFQLTSAEFKRRIDYLLENPFTLVYQSHTQFLSLIRKFHIVLPRLRYLQENNYKFATIFSLTTFHNYVEQLVSFRKMNKRNLKSFFESQFDEEDSTELLNRLQRHSYHNYVSLLQMYETLSYLKKHFPKKIIYKHIYAILYNRENLQAVHEELLKDPQYIQWPLHSLLALCIYKLEIKTHFTGEGVFLSDNDKTENINKDLNENEEEKNKNCKI